MLTASLRDMLAGWLLCMQLQCGYLRGRGMFAKNGRTREKRCQVGCMYNGWVQLIMQMRSEGQPQGASAVVR